MANPERAHVPNWPRLMGTPMAADYLSISETSLRYHGPAPKRFGKRVLYDIRDLDRWADRLDGQPLDEQETLDEAAEIERRFLERRRAQN